MTTITIDSALLEQALSAHILSLPYIGAGYKTAHTHDTVQASISALRAAIEQDRAQRGEPVAWMVVNESGTDAFVTADPTLAQADQRALPLYTAPQPERKPHTEKNVQEIIGSALREFGVFELGVFEQTVRDVLGVPKP